MNKLMRIFALSLLVLPLSVLAEVKVGFVNTAKLMEEAPQAQDASKQMETEFAPREKELISLQREIKQMEDKLTRDGAVMSESERSKAERELLNQKRDLKRSQDEFREDLNIRRNELLARLQKELNDAIVALAKAEGYDLVLFEGVVFASDRIDITDAVLEQLRRGGN
ncbi:hypothetical protein TspCOW1_05830 [Thiohalobacter sp. COW1]|uniref:Outer membrane protein OmpH n=1 Tax=Thiohalobacter thiocyanaticus TaxID=585455 RepID=A0A1Z4VS35_9GAMM|nr:MULTISPECIES: OmpH family outer membrane protein [Thiohalobacter]BAZ94451.1 outer membrane protein OmpH [Thiohalobacter thiocyanaticus]BCO30480.1 hypothetical protein TspCOW1_05830 [Thiohalobacter sp. COW1]